MAGVIRAVMAVVPMVVAEAVADIPEATPGIPPAEVLDPGEVPRAAGDLNREETAISK